MRRTTLSYGWGLLANVLGGLAAAAIMFIPAWIWSDFVVDARWDAVVGRSADLSTGDRILLYLGDLALVFLGYALYASSAKGLYHLFQDVELKFWDVFAALVATGILAAFVGFWFPFLGIVVAVFVAPALINWRAREEQVSGAGI